MFNKRGFLLRSDIGIQPEDQETVFYYPNGYDLHEAIVKLVKKPWQLQAFTCTYLFINKFIKPNKLFKQLQNMFGKKFPDTLYKKVQEVAFKKRASGDLNPTPTRKINYITPYESKDSNGIRQHCVGHINHLNRIKRIAEWTDLDGDITNKSNLARKLGVDRKTVTRKKDDFKIFVDAIVKGTTIDPRAYDLKENNVTKDGITIKIKKQLKPEMRKISPEPRLYEEIKVEVLPF